MICCFSCAWAIANNGTTVQISCIIDIQKMMAISFLPLLHEPPLITVSLFERRLFGFNIRASGVNWESRCFPLPRLQCQGRRGQTLHHRSDSWWLWWNIPCVCLSWTTTSDMVTRNVEVVMYIINARVIHPPRKPWIRWRKKVEWTQHWCLLLVSSFSTPPKCVPEGPYKSFQVAHSWFSEDGRRKFRDQPPWFQCSRSHKCNIKTTMHPVV